MKNTELRVRDDDGVIEVIKDYRGNDLTVTETARKHGISPGTLKVWLKKAGVGKEKATARFYNWDYIRRECGGR